MPSCSDVVLSRVDAGQVAGGGGVGEPRGTEASAGADEDEIEVIRCICNIYRDEGLMIQCDSCEVCDIGPVSHGFSPPPLTICPNTFEWCILQVSTSLHVEDSCCELCICHYD